MVAFVVRKLSVPCVTGCDQQKFVACLTLSCPITKTGFVHCQNKQNAALLSVMGRLTSLRRFVTDNNSPRLAQWWRHVFPVAGVCVLCCKETLRLAGNSLLT